MAGFCTSFVFLTLMLQTYADFGAAAAEPDQKEVQYALTNFILHQNYPRCSSVDFTTQRLVCEIWDAEDENSLLYLGQAVSISFGNNIGNTAVCPDGSGNKTCIPTTGLKDGFMCACKSLRKEPVSTSYQWDSRWRDTDNPHQGIYRKLCDHTNGSCVAMEYQLGLAVLVKYLNLSDDRFSSSSGKDNRGATKARIEYVSGIGCCWHTLETDPDQWVEFDLVQAYTGLGVVIRQCCGELSVPKVNNSQFKVGASLTGPEWQYSRDFVVKLGVTESYDDLFSTHWFEQPISGRYWRMYKIKFPDKTGLRGDIIGKVAAYVA